MASAEELTRQAKAPVPALCKSLICCGGAGVSACQLRLSNDSSRSLVSLGLLRSSEPEPPTHRSPFRSAFRKAPAPLRFAPARTPGKGQEPIESTVNSTWIENGSTRQEYSHNV